MNALKPPPLAAAAAARLPIKRLRIILLELPAAKPPCVGLCSYSVVRDIVKLLLS
eukprot:SAG11_NODE_18594_length_486_cov_1.496124_1_plen_54_part_01